MLLIFFFFQLERDGCQDFTYVCALALPVTKHKAPLFPLGSHLSS